jgi:hypothetical protein
MVSEGVYLLENNTVHRHADGVVTVRVAGGYAALEDFLFEYLVARFGQ